jgi:hypothetical protein
LILFSIFFCLCIGAFDWNYDASTEFYWAMDCDFPGKDSNRITRMLTHNFVNCASACDRDPVCTHFTFSDLIEGGTCFKKSGFRDVNQAIFLRGAVCGIRVW